MTILLVAVATSCVVSASVVAPRAAFPGQRAVVAAPGTTYGLHWIEPESTNGNHRLLLCDGRTGIETELLSFPRHVEVLWSASGARLAINNHWGSDEATVLLWTALPGVPLDLLEELAAQEHERAVSWVAHHIYLDAVRWASDTDLELRLWGYGEPQGPTVDRRYVYTIGKTFRRVR